jgi:acyl-CoA thioesterase-1
VFSFGANDCSDDEKGNPRVKASESVSNAGAILEAALDWLPTLMIGPATVGGDTVVNERVFALSAELATLCRRLSAPYLEICRVTSGSSPWTDEALAGDGAHPNRGGYTLVADAVSHWSAWRAWLPPRAAARGMG